MRRLPRFWLRVDAHELCCGVARVRHYGLRVVWRSYQDNRLMKPCGGFYRI